jgi:hypothetical protein
MLDKPVFTIVVAAFNRPDALSALLSDLIKTRFESKRIDLIVSIDGGGCDMDDVLRAVDWKFGSFSVINHKSNIGLARHFFYCGDLCLQVGPVVFLEEDMNVSPFFEAYTLASIVAFEDDPRIAAICLSNFEYDESSRTHLTPILDGSDTYFSRLPYWGKIWIPEKWERFKTWYSNAVDDLDKFERSLPRAVKSWPSSSFKKTYITYLIDQNLFCVMPRNALASNAALGGEHAKSMPQYQVPILVAEKMWTFKKFDESLAVYDEYGELIQSRIKRLNPTLGNYDFDVDLRGLRESFVHDYVLSSRKVSEKIFEFRDSMKPQEMAVIGNHAGVGIKFCKVSSLKQGFISKRSTHWLNYAKDISKYVDTSWKRIVLVAIIFIFKYRK